MRAGRVRHAAGALAIVLVVAACGASAPVAVTPVPVTTPLPTPTAAVATALAQVNASLRDQGLTAVMSQGSVRLGEPASFSGIPRWPFVVSLPRDPGGARFVVYEFTSSDVALAAGRDLAAYLASGPGRIQYPPDASFVLRQVGPTLVFDAWSPENSPDRAGSEALAAAIATVGSEIPVART